MQRKKDRSGLTILLVPHSQRAPISLRLPVWLLPLLTAFLVTMTVVASVFALQYYQMQRRMGDLLSQQSAERVRQREMRATILSQQDEVRTLSAQVEGFRSELSSVQRLGDEIRDILGLPTPTPSSQPTPAPTTAAQAGRSQSWGWGGGDETTAGAHVALVSPSSRSMRVAVDSGHELTGMQSTVPAEVEELQELRSLVLERVSRLGTDEHGDWGALQRDLRMWAAAPHLWPVHPHTITSEFGYRELGGVTNFHNGIDLGVWYETPVHATRDGIVTVSGWRSSFGWCIEIAHEAGYSTLYAHNSSLLVSVGDQVKAGDVIALSGSSGNSTGPHVHYEIHLWGTPVDPLRYIDEG